MNKVINANLGGNAHQLDERGYEALRIYLDNAAAKLAGNPDRQEILHDIELAIADRCRATLNVGKTVVTAEEVETILAAMGPVDDGSSAEGTEGAADATAGAARANGPQAGAGESHSEPPPPPHRPNRLYRIKEGEMIEGVCNGIAAYFGFDPTWVRLAAVVVAVLSFGLGVGAYWVMVLVVPVAETEEEKAAARGTAFTAQEFIRRARDGYYEGFRTFPDRHAHRAWKRQFKRDMRDWRRSFRAEMRAKFHGQPWTEAGPAGGAAAACVPGPGWWWVALIGAAWAMVCAAAVFSLIVTGTVFGIVWPITYPLWLGVVVLVCAHQVVAQPLHLFRRGYRRGGYHHAGLWDAVAPVILFGVIIWAADRYIPAVHHFLLGLPPMIHETVDNLRAWWARR